MSSAYLLPKRSFYRLAMPAGLAVALVFVMLSLLPGPARAGSVVYVDADATGGATGLSWTDAYTNVQDALAAAVSGDQVWVAESVYYPDEGGGGPNNALTTTFTLANGVVLYGGFDGSETQLGERDPAVHVTVLSGDIDQNDITDPNGVVTDTTNIMGANAYHVVTGGGMDASAVLDGFSVTAGNAVSPYSFGGGMYNQGSSPTLNNLVFSGNSADVRGGGLYDDNSGPTLTDVTFSGNSAGSGGGGMANTNGSAPSLSDVRFSGNSAAAGGGLYNTNSSSPALIDVVFEGNSAAVSGGGMSNNLSSSPTLTGVTFSGNSASGSANTGGGGMANNLSSPTLTDVTFSGNSAISSGGGMHNNDSSPTLTGVAFDGNGAALGGGMANLDSSPTLTRVAFTGNIANFGGGMHNLSSNPSLTDAIFSGNSANYDGGGMANDNSASTLINVTFSGNSAVNNGGGMANNGNSTPTVTNVILWGDAATTGAEIYNSPATPGIAYSDIQGCGGSGGWDPACGTDNGDNIDTDPLLVDPDGADDILGTPDDDLHLSTGSPAIDAGDNNNCPPDDQDGLPRPIDGDGDGQAVCDMGAFEYQIATTTAILADAPDPSGPGEPFTVTFTVTATLGTPTGTVTITVSGDPETCSGMLVGGQGSCALTLSTPGTFTLTATYAGEGAFSPSSATEGHSVEADGFGLYLPLILRDEMPLLKG